MLVTRDAALAERAKVMRLHGMSRDAFDRFTAKKPSWYYEIVAPGFKYNLTDIAAALGLHQLKRLPAFQTRREQIAQAYFEGLAGLPLILPPQAPAGDVHAWHLYVLRLGEQAGVDRDTFIERMYAQGIGCSVHYVPLHLHPYWRERYQLTPAQFPHSQRAYEAMVSIPLYTAMTDADVQRVIQAVRQSLLA
jgi:dTDP-4-amino-4,6-dideoxygalactose transaminase